jgi:imidazolonepropionase
MDELNIVAKGALLIRNGVIEEVGPATRVENLASARNAREIDATGRIVMPAFVDADVSLVGCSNGATAGSKASGGDSFPLRSMSRRKVLARAAAMSVECARYGCLAVGAHTRCASDLQNAGKLLRVHRALQLKPMRLRSIFSPQFPAGEPRTPAQALDMLISRWLPSIRNKKLASVVEFTVGEFTVGEFTVGELTVGGLTADGAGPALDIAMIQAAALAASALGFAIRLRSSCRLEPVHLQLALSAGAIGIVAPVDTLRAFVDPLSAVGCVRVIPASEGFDDASHAAPAIRSAIGEGAAIALTSSYRLRGPSSLNMQFLLHLAVYQLGLTPSEAIVATTWNPACSLRLSHVTGSLEPGKSADLLLMEVPDYRELARRTGHHDVSLVMRAGQIILHSPH